jgi:hypothetical protein
MHACCAVPICRESERPITPLQFHCRGLSFAEGQVVTKLMMSGPKGQRQATRQKERQAGLR